MRTLVLKVDLVLRACLVLWACLALTTAPATAQATLGLKGGVGYATLAIEEEGIEEESISGILAGMDIGVPVAGGLSLRLSGAYAQKGGGADLQDVDVALNFDSIQLSALVRIAASDDGGFSIGVMAGPWAAYLLSCEVEASGMGVNLSAPCDGTEFAQFDIETLDYGVAFGGGVEIPLFGSVRLGLDGLYSLGFAAVDEDDTRSRYLAGQTGFVFPIG